MVRFNQERIVVGGVLSCNIVVNQCALNFLEVFDLILSECAFVNNLLQ